MFTKLVISAFLSLGALVGVTVATHHRSGDCCGAISFDAFISVICLSRFLHR